MDQELESKVAKSEGDGRNAAVPVLTLDDEDEEGRDGKQKLLLPKKVLMLLLHDGAWPWAAGRERGGGKRRETAGRGGARSATASMVFTCNWAL